MSEIINFPPFNRHLFFLTVAATATVVIKNEVKPSGSISYLLNLNNVNMVRDSSKSGEACCKIISVREWNVLESAYVISGML